MTLARRDPAAADLALDCVDLSDDVDHRMRLLVAVGWSRPEAALTLAARQLGLERVEALLRERAEVPSHPRARGTAPRRRRRAAVCPSGRTVVKPLSRRTRRCCDTAGCEMPNSSWTTAVIAPDGQLALGEQLQDPASDRVAEDVERVHAPKIKHLLI